MSVTPSPRQETSGKKKPHTCGIIASIKLLSKCAMPVADSLDHSHGVQPLERFKPLDVLSKQHSAAHRSRAIGLLNHFHMRGCHPITLSMCSWEQVKDKSTCFLRLWWWFGCWDFNVSRSTGGNKKQVKEQLEHNKLFNVDPMQDSTS